MVTRFGCPATAANASASQDRHETYAHATIWICRSPAMIS